ncbi:MAG: 50S ribosomal protein L18 [bacterium]|nr:50S ribosomal protein L18 [bacterium]
MTTNREQLKRNKHSLRKGRVRSRISGLEARPRLAVFRSASHIYAQLINDTTGVTLAQASSRELKDKTAKTDSSTAVGKLIASKAKEKGISAVVFDRGGYRYHGRVKALAEGAREGGLNF